CCGLELALGLRAVALDEVEGPEEGMRLDRLRLPRDGFQEGAFCSILILLPEVEGAERQVRLRAIAHRRERLLDPFDRRIHLLGGGRRVGEEGQGVDVVRLLVQDRGGLIARLVALPPEEIDPAELEAHFVVVGRELLGLQEKTECLSKLAQLVVQEPELPRGARVGRVEPKHIAVRQDRLAILLSRSVLVAPFQITSLLSFRRARATGHDQQSNGQKNRPRSEVTRHHLFSSPISRVGIRSELDTWLECTFPGGQTCPARCRTPRSRFARAPHRSAAGQSNPSASAPERPSLRRLLFPGTGTSKTQSAGPDLSVSGSGSP